MTKSFSLLLVSAVIMAAALVPVSAQPRTSHSAHSVRYRGAWFNIDYPAGWKINSVTQSISRIPGVDSAQFSSPHGNAVFYVFSPQWNGTSQYAAVNPGREEVISHRVESVHRVKLGDGRYLYNPVAQWYTVRAKDHAYWRSWVDVEDKGLNVRHVFGIQYRNLAAYQKYRAQYDHFCQSLEQFSD